MQNRLTRWLAQRCEQENLSWSEASRRAGLSPNSISQIMNGVQPGTKRLTALADFFGVEPDILFRMAGLLPPLPKNDGVEPELERKAAHILAMWDRIHSIDPESADRLAALAELQGEMALAALRAGARGAQDEDVREDQRAAAS